MKHMGELSRRLFLKLSGSLLVIAATPSSLLSHFIRNLQVRTVEKETFRFSPAKGLIEWNGNRSEPYLLTIDGEVKHAARLSYSELNSLPRIEQVSDFHCVEGWSVKDIRWGGFRFKELLSRVEPAAQTSHVVFHSLGKTGSAPEGQAHYIESFPLTELLHPDRRILLALLMNGAPLPEVHGAPLRLIAPYDLGYKSIKFIRRIEFTREARPGWWTLANPIYPMVARVPAQRLRK